MLSSVDRAELKFVLSFNIDIGLSKQGLVKCMSWSYLTMMCWWFQRNPVKSINLSGLLPCTNGSIYKTVCESKLEDVNLKYLNFELFVIYKIVEYNIQVIIPSVFTIILKFEIVDVFYFQFQERKIATCLNNSLII